MPRHPDAPLTPGLQRRQFLTGSALSLVTLESFAQSGPSAKESAAFAGLLRQGSCAVLIRHAQTEPGIGDPPGFQLGNCSSQRQLSIEGRDQSKRMGQWFASRKLVPSNVFSSQWCRSKHTAELAFGRTADWPALNSTFGDSARLPAQTRELRERLKQLQPQQFEVWVTHQVIMTAVTNEYPAMGEAFAVDANGRVIGRLSFI